VGINRGYRVWDSQLGKERGVRACVSRLGFFLSIRPSILHLHFNAPCVKRELLKAFEKETWYPLAGFCSEVARMKLSLDSFDDFISKADDCCYSEHCHCVAIVLMKSHGSTALIGTKRHNVLLWVSD
jgi:hypothetical protein